MRASWPKLARIVVYKQLAVGAHAGEETTLTLPEGATLAFEDASLLIGVGDGRSRLAAKNVRFTSNASKPIPNAWRGAHVEEHGVVALEGCSFEATGDEDGDRSALAIEGKAAAASSVTGATFSALGGDAIVVRGADCGALAKAGKRDGSGAVCVRR
jgi:hypothetical protein